MMSPNIKRVIKALHAYKGQFELERIYHAPNRQAIRHKTLREYDFNGTAHSVLSDMQRACPLNAFLKLKHNAKGLDNSTVDRFAVSLGLLRWEVSALVIAADQGESHSIELDTGVSIRQIRRALIRACLGKEKTRDLFSAA